MSRNLQRAAVTLPKQSLFHYITDDELTQVGEMQTDPVKDIFLAALGLFGGSIGPMIEAFAVARNASAGLSILNMSMMIVGVGSAAAALVAGFLWRFRTRTRSKIIEEIRNRPKVPVHS